MRSTHLSTFVCVMCALSACGGASTESSEFDESSVAGVRLAERFEDSELTQLMPASGTASYVGVATFEFGANGASSDAADVAAQLTLQANFSDQTVAGQFSNFLDREDVRYSGSVNILNGVITGNEFGADVDGALTRPSGSSAIIGRMAGAFLGSGADAGAGLVEASAFGNPFSGVFIAGRQ